MEIVTVSFIIPVYNVQKYLPRCIESIVKQELENKEIILINDGSTDDSLTVCKRYEEKYDFIHVLDRANKGVSAARNAGILEARGEYICFVDADDFYIEEFAKDFYNTCVLNKLDIIRGIYCLYDEAGDTYKHVNIKTLSYYNAVLEGEDFLKKSIVENANEVVPWLGLFKREFLLKNSITFPEGISYEEDQLFFLKTLLVKSCKIMQVPNEFYAYRIREGSASKTPSIKKAYDVIEIVQKELELINEGELSDETMRYAKKFASASFYQLTSIYGRVDKKCRKEIKGICTRDIKRVVIKHPANARQGRKIFLFAYFPWIVDFIYDMRKKLR